jgi:hypothetical protein
LVLVAQGQTAAALADFENLLLLGDRLADGLNVAAELPSFTWLALDLNRAADADRVVRGWPLKALVSGGERNFGWRRGSRRGPTQRNRAPPRRSLRSASRRG